MYTAREFLINNDKLISEAIEEGYDIRLSEEGILNAMEKYAEYKNNNRNILIHFAKWLAFDYEYSKGGAIETVDVYLEQLATIKNCKHQWSHPSPDNGGKSMCIKCGISG